MNTRAERIRKSKWRRFGGRHNAYVRLNRQGQLEVLAHIAKKEDISDLCKELEQALQTEWELKIAARKDTWPAHGEPAQQAASLFESRIPMDFSAIPELEPRSRMKKPA